MNALAEVLRRRFFMDHLASRKDWKKELCRTKYLDLLVALLPRVNKQQFGGRVVRQESTAPLSRCLDSAITPQRRL